MAGRVELPVVMPYFTTYQWHGSAGIPAKQNPQADNWYYNNCASLICGSYFLRGRTTPELNVHDCSFWQMPFLEKHDFGTRFIQTCALDIIREALYQGYYIWFTGVDDYYIKGKSWYKERHVSHDGLITGIDEEQHLLTLVAYDSRWIYRPFQIPWECFTEGLAASYARSEF